MQLSNQSNGSCLIAFRCGPDQENLSTLCMSTSDAVQQWLRDEGYICHCSVPLCKSNHKRQPYVRFHGFPTELSITKKWIKNFKIKQGSSFVCSWHFSESD